MSNEQKEIVRQCTLAHHICTRSEKFEDILDGYLKSSAEHEIAKAATFDVLVLGVYIFKTKFDEKTPHTSIVMI